MSWVVPAATAAVNFVGGLMGNRSAAEQSGIQRRWDRANMYAQMRFQERMSNTAYRRSRDDMVEAGLNPMLMASQGGAAPPTGGGSHSSSAAQQRNPMEGVTASAMEALRVKKDIGLADTQMDLNTSAKRKNMVQEKMMETSAKNAALLLKMNKEKVPAYKQQMKNQLKRLKLEGKLIEYDAIQDRASKLIPFTGKSRPQPSINFNTGEIYND